MAKDPEIEVVLQAGTTAGVIAQPQPTARARHRFFRVSVRGLLLLVLVIGCGLGAVLGIVGTGQTQRSVVAVIYQAGGWVVYDTEWDDGQNTSTWTPRWPEWLIKQVGVDYFGNVVFINLHDRGTDAILAQVEKLEHLKQLHRPGLAVTDAGLAHLGHLKCLQLLSLDDTQVTDAGVAHLKALSSLRWIKLTRTRVTDTGIAELKRSLPNLQVFR